MRERRIMRSPRSNVTLRDMFQASAERDLVSAARNLESDNLAEAISDLDRAIRWLNRIDRLTSPAVGDNSATPLAPGSVDEPVPSPAVGDNSATPLAESTAEDAPHPDGANPPQSRPGATFTVTLHPRVEVCKCFAHPGGVA